MAAVHCKLARQAERQGTDSLTREQLESCRVKVDCPSRFYGSALRLHHASGHADGG